MSHHEDKHSKKKAQIKKNRRTWELFQAFNIMRDETDRIKGEEGKRGKVSAPAGGDDPVWSEKVATIRNRLDGKKRTSKERWNRFAGTSGGGGRGL